MFKNVIFMYMNNIVARRICLRRETLCRLSLWGSVGIQSCLTAILVIYHFHCYVWMVYMNIYMLVRIPKSDIYIFGYRYLQLF